MGEDKVASHAKLNSATHIDRLKPSDLTALTLLI